VVICSGQEKGYAVHKRYSKPVGSVGIHSGCTTLNDKNNFLSFPCWTSAVHQTPSLVHPTVHVHVECESASGNEDQV